MVSNDDWEDVGTILHVKVESNRDTVRVIDGPPIGEFPRADEDKRQ